MPGLGAVVSDSLVLGRPVALIEASGGRRWKVYERIILLGGDFTPEVKLVHWDQLSPEMKEEVRVSVLLSS
jgi:hypothetical protein